MKSKQSILCFCILLVGSSMVFAGPREDVIKELNQSSSVASSDGASSWKQFFEACIEITPPPMAMSDAFNMNTVWPGMSSWEEVSTWAEQNEHIEVAFAEAAKRAIIGLPYGSEHVPANFRDAGVYAEIGVDDRLHAFDFAYVEMVELACLCARDKPSSVWSRHMKNGHSNFKVRPIFQTTGRNRRYRPVYFGTIGPMYQFY